MVALKVVAVQAALSVGLAVPVGQATVDPGDYPVMQTLADAAASAGCGDQQTLAKDLAAIQGVESPSAVVDPTGRVSTPDGQPVRGDGGHSYGPFQFNDEAGTWARYGNGGDPDNLHDAAYATARMLCANGYGHDRRAAVRQHNGSGPAAERYADRVLAASADVGAMPDGAATAGAPAAADDCAPQSGRSFAAVGNRLWCAAIVRPWLALGDHSSDPDAWRRLDKFIFGEQTARPNGPGPTPGTLAPVDGTLCVARDHVEVGDGWGAARTGHTHEGIDIFADQGSPLVSPWDGTVKVVNNDEAAGGLGGRYVVVRARDGREVYLAHVDHVDVAVGATVRQGDQLGTVGNTGNARGGDAHVHAQLYDAQGNGPVPAGATLGAPCGRDPDA